MFAQQQACIVKACGNSGVDGYELARILGGEGVPLHHFNAPIEFGTGWDAIDRGYAPLYGSSQLLANPPVNPPIVTAATLTLWNRPVGLPLPNEHGNGGFAFRIPAGIFWNEGESWILKPAKITAVGKLTDRKTYSLPDGANSTYWYADGLECGDSRGRNPSRVPIRIFYLHRENLPLVDDIAYYVRDLDGLAWGVSDTRDHLLHAKATGNWQWEEGRENVMGLALFQDANDAYGNTLGASETTYTVYLPATAYMDPNIHTGNVVTYKYDSSGRRVATSGHLDAKIGTSWKWNEGTSTIPLGWKEDTTISGRFMVGFNAADPDYNAVGKTGGSHPIRPTAHSSENTSSSEATYDATDWYDAAWIFPNHETTDTETTATGVAVDAITVTSSENTSHVTVDALTVTSSERTTGITVNPMEATSSTVMSGVTVEGTGLVSGGTVAVVSVLLYDDYSEEQLTTDLEGTMEVEIGCVPLVKHDGHRHLIAAEEVIVTSSLGSSYMLPTALHSPGYGVTEYETTNSDHTDTAHSHALSGSYRMAYHRHAITHGHAASSSEHAHAVTIPALNVTDLGHEHTTRIVPDVTDPGHEHTTHIAPNVSDPGHEHTMHIAATVIDTGHHHRIPALSHTGQLFHRQEDFRPPYGSVLFRVRVRPEDE